MKLRIADNLTLPLESVTETIGVIAKRRMGKSYTARRFAEQLFKADQQIVIVDPKGDHWGVLSAADGKAPGLPFVILGGEHGHVPLEVGAGELVAKTIVEERVTALLDLSLFRKHEVATFMTAFLETLYRLKAREQYRTPMMLIIDEADAIAPQRPMKGEERMLGAAEDIVRRGGQRGIGCMLVTQRAAVINKNVLTQCQVIVALRTMAPQDLEALNAWIDVHGTEEERRTLMASLPSLPRGDAWFWSPGWPTADGIFQRVHVLPIDTFDSGATPAPGERRIAPKQLADVDLDALRKQMAATIERAKAEDPRELRKQIADLKKQVSKGPDVSVIETTTRELKEASQRFDKIVRERDAIIADLRKRFDVIGKLFAKAFKVNEEIATALLIADAKPIATTDVSIDHGPVQRVPVRDVPALIARQRTAGRSSVTIEHGGNVGDLKPVHMKILNALAELEALGANAPERVLVAFMSGYSHVNSTGFAKAVSSLKTDGRIDYTPGGGIVLTDAGRGIADPVDAPSSPAEVQRRIVSLLKPVHGRVLQPLIDQYPTSMTREELANRCGYGHVNSTGFAKAVSHLSSLGFLTYPSRGEVAAAPVLFMEGLR